MQYIVQPYEDGNHATVHYAIVYNSVKSEQPASLYHEEG